MKEKEEYLWELQGRLFDALEEGYKRIDRSFILTYGLSLLLVLFDFGDSTEFTFLGAKLKMKEDEILVYFPLLIGILYILVAYQLHRLTGIYSAIRESAAELVVQNTEARPLEIDDTRHFESGTAGLIISVARWQVNNLLRNNPFAALRTDAKESSVAYLWRMARVSYGAGQWTSSLLWRIPVLFIFYLLPLIIVGEQLRSRISLQFSSNIDVTRLFVFVLIVIVGVATIVSVIRLFRIYFLDSLQALRSDLKGGTKSVAEFLIAHLKQRRPVGDEDNFPDGYHQRFWGLIAHFPGARKEFIENDFDWSQLDDDSRTICEKCDELARLTG